MAQKSRQKMQPKNKWFAAILNFVLPGAGYWYAGRKRKEFAVALTAIMALGWLADFVDPSNYSGSAMASGILFMFIFAYDAYKDAEESQ